MLELAVRLVFSLAIVVGLLLLLARFGAKRFKGASNALVRVVHRQPLSRTSAVAVVTVGSRVLVLGTTEHQVRVLAELDPDELVAEELLAAELAAAGTDESVQKPVRLQKTRTTSPDSGALAGSVFSPATWKQAMAAVTGPPSPVEEPAAPAPTPVSPALAAKPTPAKTAPARTTPAKPTTKAAASPTKAPAKKSTSGSTSKTTRAAATPRKNTTPRKSPARKPATSETIKKAS